MRNRNLNSESGVYLVLMTFGFIILLGIGGLAVDSAKLYRARLHLQRAADAAVIAGIGHRINVGPYRVTSGLTLDEYSNDIEEHARQVVLTNTVNKAEGVEVALTGINFLSPNPAIDPSSAPLYDYDTESLTVRMNANIPLFLMNLVPFDLLGSGLGRFGNFINIGVISSARLQPANIAIVLDISNSMDCPYSPICNPETPGYFPNNPACTCACLTTPGLNCPEGIPNPGGATGIQNPQNKLDFLKNAVISFADGFRTDYDRLSLIPFNMTANVEVSMVQGAVPITQTEFNRAITGLNGISNTNTSDGLATAFLDASAATGNFQDDVNYVLFTDGAPNAGRFWFPDNSRLPNHSSDLGNNDYMAYSTIWLEDRIDGTIGTPLGVSALMKSFIGLGSPPFGSINFNLGQAYPVNYFGENSEAESLDVYPDCGVQYNPGGAVRGTPAWNARNYFFNNIAVRQQEPYVSSPRVDGGFEHTERTLAAYENIGLEGRLFDGGEVDGLGTIVGHEFEGLFDPLISCLNDETFSFHYPTDPTRVVGGGAGGRYDFNISQGDFRDRWTEQFYNAAIAMSDVARLNRGTVYVIGLGDNAPIPAEANTDVDLDPYQDSSELTQRKDFFLSRLALDFGVSGNDAAGNVMPLINGFRDDVVANITDLNLMSITDPAFTEARRGRYLPTDDPAELQRLFRQIQRRILLRLTQ